MVKIQGLTELLGEFKNLREKVEKNEKTARKLTAQAYVNFVKERAPFEKGDYRRSIHVEEAVIKGKEVCLAGTDKPQAKIREFGGIIKAKNGPYLKFKIDGKWVQVKLVHQTATPHFRPALDYNKEELIRIYGEALLR